jgi:hypothetical protein
MGHSSAIVVAAVAAEGAAAIGCIVGIDIVAVAAVAGSAVVGMTGAVDAGVAAESETRRGSRGSAQLPMTACDARRERNMRKIWR